VLVDGRPTPVEVTLGASSDTQSEVLAGDLKPGDRIVLNPPVEFGQNGPPFMMGN
jgi:multidrug efflux pump subunit AcrA (membrane-fusion protein)